MRGQPNLFLTCASRIPPPPDASRILGKTAANRPKGRGPTISLPVAFLGGILSFLSPCILPLLPSYVALLGAGGTARTGRRLLLALGFIAGFGLVFVLLGLSATVIGQLLARERMLLRYIGGGLVIVFGLFMLGVQPGFLMRDIRVHYSPERLGFGTAMLVGASFGFGWTACVTPWLGAILVLASQTAHWQQGAILLVAFALGLGVPFLLLGFLADRLALALRGLRGYSIWMERIGGALLVILGVLMITGVLQKLSGLGSFL